MKPTNAEKKPSPENEPPNFNFVQAIGYLMIALGVIGILFVSTQFSIYELAESEGAWAQGVVFVLLAGGSMLIATSHSALVITSSEKRRLGRAGVVVGMILMGMSFVDVIAISRLTNAAKFRGILNEPQPLLLISGIILLVLSVLIVLRGRKHD